MRVTRTWLRGSRVPEGLVCVRSQERRLAQSVRGRSRKAPHVLLAALPRLPPRVPRVPGGAVRLVWRGQLRVGDGVELRPVHPGVHVGPLGILRSNRGPPLSSPLPGPMTEPPHQGHGSQEYVTARPCTLGVPDPRSPGPPGPSGWPQGPSTTPGYVWPREAGPHQRP